MKRIVIITLALLCTGSMGFSQARWANFARYEEANANVVTTPKAVFMGDSITDGWYSKDQDFFKSNNFLGRGISGQVTGQMLVRFRRDVIEHHPKYVVILAGINDIAENQGYIDVEDTYGNIISMVELARAERIKPVICLVFPTTSIRWKPEVEKPLEKVNKLNGMLRAYGKKNHVKVVQYLKDIDMSSGRIPESLSKDSIHPNIDGYKIMEKEILAVLK